MALGIAFGLALFLTAAFNANPWDDHAYGLAPPIVSGMPAPHRDGREKMVCSSCHVVMPPKTVAGAPPGAVLPIVQGTPAPHTDGREKIACSSCHTIIAKGKVVPPAPPPAQAVAAAMTVAAPVAPAPLPGPVAQLPPEPMGGEAAEMFTPYRFQGKVLKVAGTGAQSVWGDIYVLVDDGINSPAWIDLAPRWFLQAGGCHLRTGMFVKGTAFRDPAGDSTSLVIGQTVMVNGEVCALRDHHMTGLWSHHGGGTDAEER
jgi:ferredoxin